jgi:hypothetical protein
VRCHHGLGDSIQFLRLLAPLRARAASVSLQAQAELLPLLGGMADLLLPLDAPEPAHEVAVESTELPHALRLTLDGIPAAVPYLAVPTARALPRPAPQRRIGLCWRGGDWDPRRSLPLALLAPLAHLRGIALVNLQLGTTAREAAMMVRALGFADPNPPTASVVETARRMLHLDLVISIDSMVGHLAGALGRPVWLLLHADPDWRWMLGRGNSPWYPTMRLFRQQRAGDWSQTVADVAAALTSQATRSAVA